MEITIKDTETNRKVTIVTDNVCAYDVLRDFCGLMLAYGYGENHISNSIDRLYWRGFRRYKDTKNV